MLCTELTLVKYGDGAATAEPLKCRRWSCEICNPIRRKLLVKLGREGVPDTFLTLTVNPALGDGPQERAVTLAHAWRRLRRAAMKKYKLKKLPFMAVFEATKRGEPHLHILLRVKWLDQKWISQWMASEIGAPIVDIRRITHPGQVANYVAKYIGKDPHRFEGTKRYWRSQDWRIKPEDQEPLDPRITFLVLRKSYTQVQHEMRTTGISFGDTITHQCVRIGWWTGSVTCR